MTARPARRPVAEGEGSSTTASTASKPVRSWARLARPAFASAIFPALAFVGAGRFDWLRGFLYAVLFVGVSVIGSLIVDRADPELRPARDRGLRASTKPLDRLFYALFAPLVTAYPCLAGFDAARFGWAPLPPWTVWPGVALFVLGSALSAAAMVVNRHAETTVRIQSERGHAVVSAGPYRYVRHPMYVGTMLGLPVGALVLGSAWALVPMTLIVLLFVWRTGREDLTLRRELDGYADYARSTRYRLLPGVW